MNVRNVLIKIEVRRTSHLPPPRIVVTGGDVMQKKKKKSKP